MHETTRQALQLVPLVNLTAQRRAIENEVLVAVWEVLKAGALQPNSHVRAFEAEFAAYCLTRYAVGVGSVTTAL